MMQFGVLIVLFWIVAQMLMSVSDLLIPHLAERAQDSSIALLAVGSVFVVFGFGCEMILGVIDQHRSRRDELARIADLSGRTRFERTKKKRRRLRVS